MIMTEFNDLADSRIFVRHEKSKSRYLIDTGTECAFFFQIHMSENNSTLYAANLIFNVNVT
jgi:hypothetical protein